MFSVKQLITLALAGSAIAVPLARRDGDEYQGPFGRWRGNQHYDVTPTTAASESVTTVLVSANGGQAASAPAAASPSAAAPAPSASTAASSDSASGYMGVVDEWRSKLGLSALTESSQLQANALNTVQASKGQMVHKLNPGSMAQVLAPGNANNFQSVFVGGWLCEIPSLPGLDGTCSSMGQGWDHSNGDVDHAKILTSSNYHSIGCALFDGIWACDLA